MRGMRKVDPDMSSRVMDVTTDPTIREQEFGMLQKPEVRRQRVKDAFKDAAALFAAALFGNGLFSISNGLWVILSNVKIM